MAAISRTIGTASEYLPVFIPDATVSTGAGLANIVASSVSLSWFRNDMSVVSTQTLTTGTLGTFAASSFTQASSTAALGWYGVSIPNGVFASGKSAALHLYGAPNMAPVPVLVELTALGFDNQRAISTQASTMAVNMTTIFGSPAVTTAAGVQAYAWDLGRTANLTSTIALTGASLNTVTTVLTAAAVTGLNPALLDVSVSSRLAAASYTVPAVPGDAMTLTAGERTAISNAHLANDIGNGRLVKQAYYVLRNKVDTAAGIVYATDDTTSSWGFTVSTVAGNPIVAIAPTG